MTTTAGNLSAFFPLALVTLVLSSNAQAAQTSMGKSSAELCYQAATFGPAPEDLQMCTRAIEGEDMTRNDLAATYSNRGILWVARGQFDRALDDQNQAISINPDSARAYINRANVQYRLKKYDEALADYSKAIDLSGGRFAVIYYNRSITLAAVGKRDAARADIQHALDLAPGTTAYQNALEQLQ